MSWLVSILLLQYGLLARIAGSYLLSEFHNFHRNEPYHLISRITQTVSSDTYICTSTVVFKPKRSQLEASLNKALTKHFQLSPYPMDTILTFLFPTSHNSYHLFIVFSHHNLTQPISEFIASPSFQHLFDCSTQPILNSSDLFHVYSTYNLYDIVIRSY
eukprot:459762_1